MRIAICVKESYQIKNTRKLLSEWNVGEAEIEADYFFSQESLLKVLEKTYYDIIVIFIDGESTDEEAWIRRIRNMCHDSLCSVVYNARPSIMKNNVGRYTGQFNGRKHLFNVMDICYIETLARKTSVVVGKEKIRITAKIDDEEKKFPNDLFVRASHWTLVNMLHVKNVIKDEIYMSNGDIVYISGGRRKEFLEHYQRYLEQNYRMI